MAIQGTRRELLKALVGLELGAGCLPKAKAPSFGGGFVDGTYLEAHRLRHEAARPASSPAFEVPVLILGGGVAGLAAGRACVHMGLDRFLILELGESLGGTAVMGRSSVTEFPWGAHYLPVPRASNASLVRFLVEAKVAAVGADGTPRFAEEQLCAAPKERIFHRGLWQRGLVPEDLLDAASRGELDRFEEEVDRWVALEDGKGRRAFTLPLADGADLESLEALDRVSMSEWMEAEGFRSPALRLLVGYACRDDFGARPEAISAWYGLHYFASRKVAPGEESAEFLTWPGGNGHLVRALARAIPSDRILLRHLVTAVSLSPTGQGVRVDAIDLATGRATAFAAARVIYALPTFTRRRVLGPGLQNGAVEGTPLSPWLVANLHLSDRPRSNGFPLSWDNVIADSESLGYVVATHQEGPERGPTVFTYYRPFSGPDLRSERERLLSLPWVDAAEGIVSELERCHRDFRRIVEKVEIMRFGHGTARPVPGTRYSKARARALEAVGPVHFAHTDLSGVSLFEEAFFHGERAAAEVVRALG